MFTSAWPDSVVHYVPMLPGVVVLGILAEDLSGEGQLHRGVSQRLDEHPPVVPEERTSLDSE